MHLTSFLAAAAIASLQYVSALPIEEKRATADPGAFPEMQRAAQLSSAAYSICQFQAFDVTITKQINSILSNTEGYVGYSTSKQRISVVMRGSTEVQDFVNDLDIAPVIPLLSGVSFPFGSVVMAGVYLPWVSVHDEVMAEVRNLVARFPTYSIEATGHSLGGSLSYLSYVALVQNFPGKSVTARALAAFPIGNSVFASWAGGLPGTMIRGTNAADGVPNMYTAIFTHYGTEIFSSGTASSCVLCSGERDNACSAGDGYFTVSLGHLQSFGINMALDGCGGGIGLPRRAEEFSA
ncbi:hypothetical protein MMC25_008243 [Agyrium rufum]|nr:hypothetical protein [Agyrium rufum]